MAAPLEVVVSYRSAHVHGDTVGTDVVDELEGALADHNLNCLELCQPIITTTTIIIIASNGDEM